MAVSTTVTPSGISRHRTAKVADVENSYSRDASDIFGGPANVVSIEVQNFNTSGTASWVKIYDDITTGLVPGTTRPDFIIPVAAYASNPAGSKALVQCPDGMEFVNGVSVFASQADGNDATAAPADTVDVFILA